MFIFLLVLELHLSSINAPTFAIINTYESANECMQKIKDSDLSSAEKSQLHCIQVVNQKVFQKEI